jgi:hypothetical protein
MARIRIRSEDINCAMEGIVFPTRKTRRSGLDLGAWRPWEKSPYQQCLLLPASKENKTIYQTNRELDGLLSDAVAEQVIVYEDEKKK